jgi:HK97 family phage prohead protease
MSGLEFGAGGGMIKFSTAPLHEAKSPPRYVEGLAIAFSKCHPFNGIIDVFMPGCCDVTLQNKSRPVDFKEDHAGLPITGTAEGDLELYADRIGLTFRVRMPENANGSRAFNLIESVTKSRISPGYKVVDSEYLDIDGSTVRKIKQIELIEISFCKDGAVPWTFAAAGTDLIRHFQKMPVPC